MPGSPRGPREEKDPGSAFGPESVPLATGSVPRCLLGTRAPSRPNPTSSRMSAGEPSCPSQCRTWPRGGWLRAPLPWHSPDLISLPVWLASPCWTDSATYPRSRQCQPSTLLAGHGRPLVVSGVYTFRALPVKIGRVCPLARGAFGVWITPLNVSRRPPGHSPQWPALGSPWR